MINFGSDDIGGTSLPHIPEAEIQRVAIEEDLSEIERIQVLLSKKNPEQKSYFFNNILNIFRLSYSQIGELKVNTFDK